MSLADQASLLLIPSGYKSQKVYSIFPTDGDGDFDFSRSGSATRIAKNGLITTVDSNVPRLEYPMIDGVVNGCPSLLLEPQRTNSFTYSEDFSQSYWNKNSASVTLTSKIAPNGTLNSVYNLVGTAANLWSAGTIGTQHTISFYIKSNGQGKDKFRLRLGNNTSIEYTATNEWVRYEYTETPTTSVYSITTSSAPNNEYDLLVWGGQAEQGSFQTSYIPTNGSAVTRNAETCDGAGDAATFNDSEGVLMAEISALDSESTNKMITISNGSNSTRILIRYVGTTLLAQLRISGANQYEFGYDPTNIKDNFKIAIKYKANDFSFFVNGFELDSSNSGSTFSDGTLTELAFDDGGGSNDFYGNTKQVQYYNSALTDSELEQLTSWTSFTDMAEGQLYTIE